MSIELSDMEVVDIDQFNGAEGLETLFWVDWRRREGWSGDRGSQLIWEMLLWGVSRELWWGGKGSKENYLKTVVHLVICLLLDIYVFKVFLLLQIAMMNFLLHLWGFSKLGSLEV